MKTKQAVKTIPAKAELHFSKYKHLYGIPTVLASIVGIIVIGYQIIKDKNEAKQRADESAKLSIKLLLDEKDSDLTTLKVLSDYQSRLAGFYTIPSQNTATSPAPVPSAPALQIISTKKLGFPVEVSQLKAFHTGKYFYINKPSITEMYSVIMSLLRKDINGEYAKDRNKKKIEQAKHIILPQIKTLSESYNPTERSAALIILSKLVTENSKKNIVKIDVSSKNTMFKNRYNLGFTNFPEMNFSSFKFDDTTFTNARFDNTVNFEGGSLKNTTFLASTFSEKIGFNNVKLNKTIFDECDFTNDIIIKGGIMKNVQFKNKKKDSLDSKSGVFLLEPSSMDKTVFNNIDFSQEVQFNNFSMTNGIKFAKVNFYKGVIFKNLSTPDIVTGSTITFNPEKTIDLNDTNNCIITNLNINDVLHSKFIFNSVNLQGETIISTNSPPSLLQIKGSIITDANISTGKDKPMKIYFSKVKVGKLIINDSNITNSTIKISNLDGSMKIKSSLINKLIIDNRSPANKIELLDCYGDSVRVNKGVKINGGSFSKGSDISKVAEVDLTGSISLNYSFLIQELGSKFDSQNSGKIRDNLDITIDSIAFTVNAENQLQGAVQKNRTNYSVIKKNAAITRIITEKKVLIGLGIRLDMINNSIEKIKATPSAFTQSETFKDSTKLKSLDSFLALNMKAKKAILTEILYSEFKVSLISD